MLDINVVNITIPPAEFQTIITMPSLDFQKIVRDMHNLADFMEIRCFEDQLIFSCKGDFSQQTTVLNVNDGSNVNVVKNTERPHEIIQGVFSLKYLASFTKCSGLSNNMEIYLRSDYPMIIVHRVAALGQIKLALASHDTQATS
jgi:proliferating cell nuclear antigen